MVANNYDSCRGNESEIRIRLDALGGALLVRRSMRMKELLGGGSVPSVGASSNMTENSRRN